MKDRAINLKLSGGTFCLTICSGGGRITSNLHFDSLEKFLDAGGQEPGDPLNDQFSYGRYEGAIDALESLILAAVQAGIEVRRKPFTIALQAALDAIGHNL